MSKKLTTADFIEKARAVHGDTYGYELVNYTSTEGKVRIVCPSHGEYLQKASKHAAGQGCPVCRYTKSAAANNQGLAGFIEKALAAHGRRYDYSCCAYVNSKTRVSVLCERHGEFKIRPAMHIAGQGCRKCANEKQVVRQTTAQTVALEKAVVVHGGRYDYSQCIYSGAYGKMSIRCTRHGMFEQTYNDHVNNGHHCPKCAKVGPSKFELGIMEFVQSLCPDAVGNDRTVIAPKELDIYVPSAKVAIECNGVHFHSDKYKKKHEHRDKTRAAEAVGVRLIHITDADWAKHRTQMERMIKNALGKSDDLKLNARDCVVREITVREANAFLAQYHPQGAGGTNVTAYGLDHKVHGLCAVMTFAKDAYRRNPATAKRDENWGKWDLTRYTTAHSVRGGASKLFKYFVANKGVDEVQSFSANDWFGGGLYPALGFQIMEEIEPDYKVFHPKIGLRGKSTWRRKNIPVRLKEIGANTTFDPATDKRTEWMVEDEVGAKRIWDTGKIRWQWKAENNT